MGWAKEGEGEELSESNQDLRRTSKASLDKKGVASPRFAKLSLRHGSERYEHEGCKSRQSCLGSYALPRHSAPGQRGGGDGAARGAALGKDPGGNRGVCSTGGGAPLTEQLLRYCG